MATQFDQTLKLLISADGKGLSAGLQKALGEVKSFTSTATNAFRTLGQVAGISIGVETLRRTVALVDSYRTLEARIKGITAETADYAAVSERLRAISRATGTQLETTVGVFQALARSAKELGATNEQMTTLTRLVQQLGVLGGASTQALGDGLRQFSQAMGAGVVRAEEFNSILENLPELAAAIAKGLGVTVAELRKMVVAGKLLSKDVFDALLGQAGEIERRFAEMPLTAERGWIAFEQSATRILTKLSEKAAGLTELIGRGFRGWADFLDPTAEQKFNDLIRRRQQLLSQPPTGPGGRANPAYAQAQRELVDVERQLRELQSARIDAQKKEAQQADEATKLTIKQKLAAQDAEAAVKGLNTAYDKLIASLRAGQADAAAGPKKELEKSTVLDINALRDKARTALEKGDTKAAEAFIKQAQAVNDYLLETQQVTKSYYQTQADLLLGLAEAGRAILNKEKPKVALEIDEKATADANAAALENQRRFWSQNPAYQPVISVPAGAEAPISSGIQGYTEEGRAIVSAAGITGRAAGGLISGPGTSVSDSILARLSAGEFVVRAQAVKSYGLGFLERLNSMALPRFATGGMVSTGTPVNLYLPGGQSFPMTAQPSVAKQLASILSAEVLKRGRR